MIARRREWKLRETSQRSNREEEEEEGEQAKRGFVIKSKHGFLIEPVFEGRCYL